MLTPNEKQAIKDRLKTVIQARIDYLGKYRMAVVGRQVLAVALDDINKLLLDHEELEREVERLKGGECTRCNGQGKIILHVSQNPDDYETCKDCQGTGRASELDSLRRDKERLDWLLLNWRQFELLREANTILYARRVIDSAIAQERKENKL